MENKLNFRALVKSDYDTIVKWWKHWKFPVLPRQMLPDNGEGGFMVEKNGRPIVSAFLYLSNAPVGMLEWTVSDPDYREEDRKEAIELLITCAEAYCKGNGKSYMFTIGRSKSLIEIHRKLGWSIDDKPSHEITKKL